MASGLPDYYRGVDVAYQALSQMIVRPKYGGGQTTSAAVVVTANDDTVLITVSGKGMLYGGVLLFDYTSTQKNSIPVLAVDDKKIGAIKYDTLNKYSISKGGFYPVVLTIFDDVNFIYGVSFSYGLTFETELGVSFIEAHGTTPSVYCSVVYALI